MEDLQNEIKEKAIIRITRNADIDADALKLIPAPQEDIEEISQEEVAPITNKAQEAETQEDSHYYESTRVDVKPSLWQRFKESKFVRTIKYIMKVRIVLDVPALPSGDENKR